VLLEYLVFRLFKDVLAVNTTLHHVVDARHAMFSSCSWYKKPTLVELETESSTVYCGEESKTCPYDSRCIMNGYLLDTNICIFALRDKYGVK